MALGTARSGGIAIGAATGCLAFALTARWLVANPLSVVLTSIVLLVFGGFVGGTAGTFGAILLASVVVLWLNSTCSHRLSTRRVAVLAGVGVFTATACAFSFAGTLCLIPAIYAAVAAHHLAVSAALQSEDSDS